MIEYFGSSKHFHLIAHSFGSYIALKLAEKLESLGKAGHITFIDGAPAFLKALTVEHIKERTDIEYVQNVVLGNILANTLRDVVDDEFILQVFKQPTWAEKTNMLADYPKFLNLYGKEYSNAIMNALVNRIRLVLMADTTISSLTNTTALLVRPITVSVINISENYDLDVNFKEGHVDVNYLDGDHFSILENPKLMETVNQLHASIGI